MEHNRSIVLDTETTGLDPKQGHKIVEIGAIELINRKATGQTLHYYLQPDLIMDDDVIKIHGITNEFLVDKPRFADISDDFFAFINNAELIIHNANFDLKFISHEFSQTNNPLRANIHDYCTVVDTLLLARQKYPGQKNNLDALCRRLGVDNSKRTVHGALLDAQLLTEVYLIMTGGQTTLNIDVSDVNLNSYTLNTKLADTKHIPTKIIYANDEELALHQQMMHNIFNKK